NSRCRRIGTRNRGSGIGLCRLSALRRGSFRDLPVEGLDGREGCAFEVGAEPPVQSVLSVLFGGPGVSDGGVPGGADGGPGGGVSGGVVPGGSRGGPGVVPGGGKGSFRDLPAGERTSSLHRCPQTRVRFPATFTLSQQRCLGAVGSEQPSRRLIPSVQTAD